MRGREGGSRKEGSKKKREEREGGRGRRKERGEGGRGELQGYNDTQLCSTCIGTCTVADNKTFPFRCSFTIVFFDGASKLYEVIAS